MPTSAAEASFTAINRAKYAGLTGTIIRGSDSTAGVQINLAKSRLEVVDGAVARIEDQTLDFIVRAADYKFGGAASNPKKSDRIRFVRQTDGKTATYELVSPPYDPHDHAGEFFRLHGVRVSVQ